MMISHSIPVGCETIQAASKYFFFVCLNDKKPENNFVEDKEDEEKKSDLVSPRRFELSVAKR